MNSCCLMAHMPIGDATHRKVHCNTARAITPGAIFFEACCSDAQLKLEPKGMTGLHQFPSTLGLLSRKERLEIGKQRMVVY
ncbi:hypothetical protein D3C75_1303020 [compost metagenome]